MKRKPIKIVAIVAVLSLIAPFTFYFHAAAVKETPVDIPVSPEKADTAVAADISNMTGVKAEEVLRLKQTGLTWNEVLAKLRTTSSDTNIQGKSDRLQTLTGESIGEDFVNELLTLGYDRDAILEAKLLAERVQVQLGEVAENAKGTPTAPTAPSAGSPLLQSAKEANTEGYLRAAGSYDVRLAVKWTLKLQGELGGLEQAMNEYLCALQLGLKLEDYEKDKEAYKQLKEQKKASLLQEEPVTAAGLEQLVIQNIEKQNDRNRLSEPSSAAGSQNTEPAKRQDNKAVPLPEAPADPVPVIKDVRPVNPTEQVMNEIKALNPNK